MSQAIILPNPIVERPSSLLQRLRSSASTVMERVANDSTVTKVRDHKLTKTFMKVAEKSGLKVAFKLAAAGTAGALGANVYGVALAGGAGMTLAEAIRDYAHWRKEQENQTKGIWGAVKGFFSFVGGNKAKYAGNFLKNTGLGFLGAEIGAHLDDIKDFAMNIPGLSALAEKTKDLAGAFANGIIGVAHAQEVRQVLKEMPVADVTALAAFTDLAKIDTTGWDSRALSDLKAAQAGKPWALQNLADYAANGRHGMTVNYDMARELAQQAGAKGSKLSAGFLQDLDKVAPRPTMTAEDLAAPDMSHASEPQTVAPDVSAFVIPELDTTGWDARALSDLQDAQAGKPWALQNMAYYAANGKHGVDVDLGVARKFAELAKLKGDENAERFLSDLDRLARATRSAGTAAAQNFGAEHAAESFSAAAADSNVCFVANDVEGLEVEGLQHVDFTIHCENMNTRINPGADVLIKDQGTGRLLHTFRNAGSSIRSVRDMFQNIVNTIIFNKPANDNMAEIIMARSNAAPAASMN